MEVVIDTIDDHIRTRHAVSVHCDDQDCRRWRVLDLMGLCRRLGGDFSMLHSNLAPRLRCSACGGRRLGFTLHPPTTQLPDGSWGNVFMDEEGRAISTGRDNWGP